MNLPKFLSTLSILGIFIFQTKAQYQENTFEKAPTNWFNLDFTESGIRGVSTERAYRDILAKKVSKTIIVAIIDSGVDVEHEDLKGKIWVNPKEYPNNGIDDDHNGFIDDINGWDFLGAKDGTDIARETMEVTREYSKLKNTYQYVNEVQNLSPKMKYEYDLYHKYKAKYEAKVKELQEQGPFVIKLYEKYLDAKQLVATHLKIKSDNLTDDDWNKITTRDSEELKKAKRIFDLLNQIGQDESKLKEAYEYYDAQFKFGVNLAYNPRTIIGDDVENVNDHDYGNNEVKGPDARHGTHVAGIIAANRDNTIGVSGICGNVKLMILRTIPEGDERDKDVANAIRYAADNGAMVVNMSFGKSVSPQKLAVDAAVKYAQSKGVLFVHAAGNENENIDVNDNFPTKKYADGKVAENWIEVGATSWMSPPNTVAEFSNYGRIVDVFAPGVDLKSTVVGSKYEDLSGTSMSAPVVTGIAALLMSYFPDLDARQIKKIILDSSTKLPTLKVTQPGSGELVDFAKLSYTGGIANAYEAVRMAEEMSKTISRK